GFVLSPSGDGFPVSLTFLQPFPETDLPTGSGMVDPGTPIGVAPRSFETMRNRTDWVRSITAWIFDLDNTLVECHRYYEETRKAVYEMLLRTGVPVTWSEFEQQLGVVRKPLFQSIGFGHESF